MTIKIKEGHRIKAFSKMKYDLKWMKRNSVQFFVVIVALSLFILCLFFLEEVKKREREINGAKKSPFHPLMTTFNNLCY